MLRLTIGIQNPIERSRKRGTTLIHCEEPFGKLRIESATKQSHPPIEIAALSLAMTPGASGGFREYRALPGLS